MSPERLREIEVLYHLARERSPTERAEVLAQANPELRREVESLLAQPSGDGLLDRPALEIAATLLKDSKITRLRIGEKLGPYEIEGVLGEGGMGQVYSARDPRLDRVVAIKVLSAAVSGETDRQRRFEQEARAVAALNHPNILTIHDMGYDNGSPYIVSELLEGDTLRERLSQLLPIPEVIECSLGIAYGLAAAHAKGIVHRDLKPSNVFITTNAKVKILDFGLAKITRAPAAGVGTSTASLMTQPGVVMGTVGYMSPEQAMAREVDYRSDQFSFGAILYEMVTGKRAFERGSTAETLAAIIRDEPEPIVRKIPTPLGSLVTRCLAKEPEKRFASTADLVSDLEDIRNHHSRELSETAAVPRMKHSETSSLRSFVFILALVMLAAALAASYYRAHSRYPGIKAIAVLPIKITSSDPDMEYLSDGITDTLIGDLSRLPNLRVLARSSVYRYKDSSDPRRVGNELRVPALVIGELTQRGSTFTLRVELVRSSDGSLLWSKVYERREIAALASEQRQISRDIATSLRPFAIGGDKEPIVKHRVENPEVYALYLKGRYYWNKRDDDSIKKAIEFFDQALEKDPSSALPYMGLADAYMFQSHQIRPNDIFPRAKAAARKALELDDSLAEPHVALEYISLQYDWNWAETEKQYRQAIQLNPNYATAYSVYSRYLMAMGRFDEAEEAMKTAEQLDPLSLGISTGLGLTLHFARKYDAAISQFHKTLEFSPNFSTAVDALATTYVAKGNLPEAIQLYEQTLRAVGNDATVMAELASAYELAGRKDQAARMIEQLMHIGRGEYVPPYDFAIIYIAGGHVDLAFNWLEKAYSDRSWAMNLLKIEPRMDKLRPDPRFQNLLNRIGLAR
jgi:serine/threonine protein kinase/Flp pilus assembly protein TadD